MYDDEKTDEQGGGYMRLVDTVSLTNSKAFRFAAWSSVVLVCSFFLNLTI